MALAVRDDGLAGKGRDGASGAQLFLPDEHARYRSRYYLLLGGADDHGRIGVWPELGHQCAGTRARQARLAIVGSAFRSRNYPTRTFPERLLYRHYSGCQGRKMSKSLGNSPDPLTLIDKYGADGLRFGIISMAPQGQDIRFQEE